MNRLTTYLSMSLAGLLLAACQKAPPRAPPAPETLPPPHAAVGQPGAPPQRAALMSNIDDYKMLVAAQIMQTNPALVFSGRLPPMLPAIVVVRISVDRNGALNRVVVQRSRDSEASKVALAAVNHGVPYPKPMHLLLHGHKTLDFSETFLFGDEYHFKLRTLAGPQ